MALNSFAANSFFMPRILTMIMAGGRGERLEPLTRYRSKPAVPFGGRYRLIDPTLANCLHSGVGQVYILTQYKADSLIRHVTEGYMRYLNRDEFIRFSPAQEKTGKEWYRGTADSVRKNIDRIREHEPDYVLILAGDHIYSMNLMDMVKRHEERGTEGVTIAAKAVPVEEAGRFGVMELDGVYRIHGFEEKPESLEKAEKYTIPGDSKRCAVSMGIYVWNTDLLVKVLEEYGEDTDFGRHVLPKRILKRHIPMYAYPFDGEWMDVGTMESYHRASMGTLPEERIFDLEGDFRLFPVSQREEKVRRGGGFKSSKIDNVNSGVDAWVEDSKLCSVVLSNGDRIYSSRIEESVLFEDVVVEEGCEIKRAVIDKNVRIWKGMKLSPENPGKGIVKNGILVIPKGSVIK